MEEIENKSVLEEIYNVVCSLFFGCVALVFVYKGITSIGEVKIDLYVYLIGAMVSLLLSRNY